MIHPTKFGCGLLLGSSSSGLPPSTTPQSCAVQSHLQPQHQRATCHMYVWMIASAIVSLLSAATVSTCVEAYSFPIRNLSIHFRRRRVSSHHSILRMSTNASARQQQQYHLLKSEPSEYSIQQLQQDGREEWSGVRNYTARNHLKAMKRGDRCFYYHSSCKEPSIVGTCRVAREAQPDPTAVDPAHKNYDPKSSPSTNPWVSVLVEFEAPFDTRITVKELRAQSTVNPVIANMVLLRQSRLSVMPVSPEEWQAVLDLQSRKERGEDLLSVQGHGPTSEKSKATKRTKTPETAVAAASKKTKQSARSVTLNVDDPIN